MNKSLKNKLSFAKNQLILLHPFYANLLLNSEIIWTETIPTGATDGKDILLNPNYIEEITNHELIGLLCHEVLHKAFLHALRLKERNPKIYNYACDYVINPIVKSSGIQLPKGALYKEEYAHMTAEAVYNLLKKKNKEEFGDAPEHLVPLPNLSDSEARQLEQNAKQELAAASTIAEQAGKLPGAIKKMIGDILDPKVDWREQLRAHVQKAMGHEHQTWNRFNKRFIGQDIYLPSTFGEETPPLVIMIDVSGSIFSQKALFEEFTAEINAIIEDTSPEEVHVIYTDTKIQGHDIFPQGDEFKPNLKGNGGTDFTKFFNYVIEQDIQASTIICFTDLYASGLPTEYDIPITWVVYGNKRPDAPLGDVIIID